MRFTVLAFTFAALLLSSCEGTVATGNLAAGNTYYVSSLEELSALGTLGAGDTVVWKKGTYQNIYINFKGSGTADNPVVFTGEGNGETIFTGSSRFQSSGHNVVVTNLWYKDPILTDGGKHVIIFSNGSYDNRLTQVAITGDNTPEDLNTDYKWVSLYGTGHRVDNCTFRDKRNIGTLLVVWFNTEDIPAHTIENNYFSRPVSLYDENNSQANGQETIRIGTSDYSMQAGNCIVRNNYFFQCDGETEIISNKSGGNLYENNLFEESQGTLTLRHGNDCIVKGNYFLANAVANTGGIRIIGERHTVTGNYLENLRGSGYKTGLCIVRGQVNPALNGYWQVKDCKVSDNIFVDCRYAFHTNYGSSQTLPAIRTEISNNIVTTTTSSYYMVYNYEYAGEDVTWTDNTLYGGRLVNIDLPVATTAPSVPSVTEPTAQIRAASGVNWL